MREMCRARLENEYEVVDTGDAERAVLMALQHKPDIILLDLSMPRLSGFEVCRTLSALSFTHHIPIFVISGEDERNKVFCQSLGAAGYFRKPIDFVQLKLTLMGKLPQRKPEIRAHPRVQLKALLKLRGKNADGQEFEIRAVTENISAGGFLASCDQRPEQQLEADVYFCSGDEHYLGRARVVRTDLAEPQHPRFGFQFIETANWGLAKATHD
jgi:DNA-binding response OmpR family regulator